MLFTSHFSQSNVTYSSAYADWLASHPEDRVFDDIVSCLRFSQQQYDSKALSVAGIGCGGGWALKVTLQVCVWVLHVYSVMPS
jgi:hypothetical protein